MEILSGSGKRLGGKLEERLGGGNELPGSSESHFAGQESLRTENMAFRANGSGVSSAERLSGFFENSIV